MSTETDLIKLYSTRILSLAADIPHTARLNSPAGSAKVRAPLCGSTITVDINIENGVITGFGQDVKACALGQASASIVGSVVIGRTRAEIEAARDQLTNMLKASGPVPNPPFDGFEVLQPAAAYKNRHASIMLALEGTLQAWDSADQS